MTISNNEDQQKKLRKKFSLSLAGLILLPLSTNMVMAIVFGRLSELSVRSLNAVVFTVIAVLILHRHSRHMVGWLFLVIGLFSMLSEVERPLLSIIFHGVQANMWVDWLGSITWQPWSMIPITLVLLYFPQGRLPNDRWRPVAFASILGISGITISHALHPRPWESQGFLQPNNPAGIPRSEAFFETLFILSGVLLLIGVLGSVLSISIRFRVSHGVIRNQMKWLFYPSVVGISALFLSWFVSGFDNLITYFIFTIFPTLMASMLGIAILRHQLFDIDIIIRRTLQYGLLTGVLGLLYYGGIILLQGILGLLTGQNDSPIIIVLATLGLAAIFTPLRTRIQVFIDQRFYRTKYDSEKALAGFAAAARDEVDITVISAKLLQVVAETVQPMDIQLLLKIPAKRQSN